MTSPPSLGCPGQQLRVGQAQLHLATPTGQMPRDLPNGRKQMASPGSRQEGPRGHWTSKGEGLVAWPGISNQGSMWLEVRSQGLTIGTVEGIRHSWWVQPGTPSPTMQTQSNIRPLQDARMQAGQGPAHRGQGAHASLAPSPLATGCRGNCRLGCQDMQGNDLQEDLVLGRGLWEAGSIGAGGQGEALPPSWGHEGRQHVPNCSGGS